MLVGNSQGPRFKMKYRLHSSPYLGAMKQVCQIYAESYKILIKESKKIEIIEKTYWGPGLENSTVKKSVLPKLICRFNRIPITIPGRLFINTDKIILKFISKGRSLYQSIKIAETVLKRGAKWKQSVYPISNLTQRSLCGMAGRWAY